MNILVLLDFSKAFDNVDHNLLIHKLSSLGFDRTTCHLLWSYLNGRRQYVVQSVDASSDGKLMKGVPQGSVMGPLLFSLYINDLPSKVKFSKCHLFADDVQLHASGIVSEIDDLISGVNLDLSVIHKWALENKLTLNPKKSQCIFIHRTNIHTSSLSSLYLGGEEVMRCTSVKNLGVHFDEKLSWSVHVSNVCSKVRSSLRRLWMIAWALPIDTKLMMVKTLLVPYFTYGCRVFSSLTRELFEMLNKAFNACTRFVFGCRKYDRLGTLKRAVLNCTLSDLYEMNMCLLLFKIIRSQEPSYLYERLRFSRSTRTLNLLPPSRRLSSLDGMFFIRSTALWNSLPLTLKAERSYTTFKRKYKELQHL